MATIIAAAFPVKLTPVVVKAIYAIANFKSQNGARPTTGRIFPR